MNTVPKCNYNTDQVKPIKFQFVENCPPIEQNHSPFLQKIYKLGHGREFQNHEEAADWLLKRDHQKISDLDQKPKSLGGYFVPPYYFSACPRIIQPENVAKLQDLVMKYKSTADTDTESKIAYLGPNH